MNPNLPDIDTFLARHTREFILIRRRLHQLAELSTLEYETGRYLCSLLSDWDIPYEYPIADTGLVATIRGRQTSHTAKTVALRADMDALPIFEDERCPFHSLNPGVMHACGHDAHMTIALGAARYFKQIEAFFSGCIRIFFQPAEETVGGAARMIAEGCMEHPPVDYCIGLHMAPQLETGTIETKYGKLYASSDEVAIVLYGKNSHGAYPESGVDAIVMAAALILSLQTIASRNVSPLDQYVLTLGTIRGGSAHNIIADSVELTGALRTTSPATRSHVKDLIHQQVRGIAESFDGTGRVTFSPGYDALINTNALADRLRETAIPILGKEHVLWKESPGMGVEDFSAFLEKAPGVFYHLGCGTKAESCSEESSCAQSPQPYPPPSAAPLHSREFSLNENSLAIGIRLQTALALSLLSASDT